MLSLAVTAAQEDLATRKRAKLKELFPANQALTEEPVEVAGLGEGGDQKYICQLFSQKRPLAK